MNDSKTMRRRGASDSSADYDKERERKRRLWKIQQEKEREHERLKQKKIEEYERERAKKLGLPYKGRSSHRSRSKSRSRSRSEESRQRSHSRPAHNNNVPQVVPRKPNSTPGNKPLFNGPSEAPKLSETDLRQVTVKIHRKIPAPALENSEIKREVVNPEEITLKRRDGEGSKPIFDRDELKQLVEVEERRIVEASGRHNQVNRGPRPKRRSVSLSPRRHRSPSPHSRSGRSDSRSHSHRSRHEEYSRHHLEDRHSKDHRSDRHHSRTRNGSREDPRRHRSPRRRSQSREREYRRSERERPRNVYSTSRSEKDYREYRGRSKERSYDRRDRREPSAERHHPSAAAYMEPLPYPMFYGGFPRGPVLIPPPALPPIRIPAAGRGRMPMAPVRPPYAPRFAPPEMYRGLLPDPRYRMF